MPFPFFLQGLSATSANFNPLWSVDFTGQTPGNFGTLSSQLGGYLSLARASAATVQTSASTVDTTPSTNQARIYYDGYHQGLCLEETRTNYIQNNRMTSSATGWSAANGTSTYGYATSPDGTSNGTRTVLTSGTGYGHNGSLTLTGTWVVSGWMRVTSTSVPNIQWGCANGSNYVALQSITTGTTTWSRAILPPNSTTNPVYISSEARAITGGSGGNSVAEAIDMITDLWQLEVGNFATEVIDTPTSGSATRAGEHLSVVSPAGATDGYVFNPYFKFYPKGASSQYTTKCCIFDFGNGTNCYFNNTTGQLSIQVNGGIPWVSGGLAWNAFDLVEIQITNVGSASLPVAACFRTNGGTVYDLGNSITPLGTFTVGSTLDLLCSGSTYQLTSIIAKIAMYHTGAYAMAPNGEQTVAGIPASAGTIQDGYELSNFSSSNYFSATGSGFAFGANTSLCIGFDVYSLPSSTVTLAQFALSGTNGWQIQLTSAGNLQLTYPSHGSVVSLSRIAVTPGFHVACVAWDAATTNTMRCILDNESGGVGGVGIVAMTATTSSSVSVIGNDDTLTTAFTTGAVLWLKGYSIVLPDNTLATISGMGQQNRWLPVSSGSYETDCVLDWEVGAARDWNGVASTSTSQGSSPITYTVHGSPTLQLLQELYVPWSNMVAYAQDLYSSSDPYGNMGRLSFVTTDTVIYVDATTEDFTFVNPQQFAAPVFTVANNQSSATYCGLAYGSWVTGVKGCNRVALGGLGKQNVEVWTSPQWMPALGSTQQYGTTIQAVRFGPTALQPVGAFALPANRMVICGDSISACGWYGFPTGQNGNTAIYRNETRSDLQITLHGWGNASLYSMCNTFFASATAYANFIGNLVATQVASGGGQYIEVALQTNDYGAAFQTASQYQTLLTSFLNALHTAAPSAHIRMRSCTTLSTTLEATSNAKGNIPDDYRTAASNAVSGIAASWCSYANYKNVINPATDLYADGVHPNVAGNAKVAAQLKTDYPF